MTSSDDAPVARPAWKGDVAHAHLLLEGGSFEHKGVIYSPNKECNQWSPRIITKGDDVRA